MTNREKAEHITEELKSAFIWFKKEYAELTPFLQKSFITSIEMSLEEIEDK